MKIVFMGTPGFAVPSLQILVDHGYEIGCVITAPDKPAGRGMHIQMSPIKQAALQNNLTVLQPEKLKDPLFIQELKLINADLFIVVAFRMLPEIVWAMPPLGTFNLHGSLLPDYRGAAPINWAIINGEKVTGVSTFFLQHAIDTGDILFKETLPIDESDTAGLVHDKMMIMGANLVLRTVQAIEQHKTKPIPQVTSTVLKLAPKINTADCLLDFNQPVQKVYNRMRGLSPYPGAYTHLNNKILKIYMGDPVIESHAKTIGSFETDGLHYMKFYTPDGYLNATDIQLEGKKRMSSKEFLKGYKSV